MARDKHYSLGRSSYWLHSQEPLQALVFLLPMILLYEIGVLRYSGHQDIVARRLVRSFFELLGVTGYHLPAVAVVVTLLCWHLARRDPWQIEPKHYGLMWVESIVVALPLFIFARVLFRDPIVQAGGLVAGVDAASTSYTGELLLSFGAGIYEELVFRLVAIAFLHLILYDVLALPRQWAAVAAVAVSAVAFALYHFSDRNPFNWGRFLFYTAAGVYFAAVYLLRGFGVAAGCHAMYDVFVVLMKMYAEANHS